VGVREQRPLVLPDEVPLGQPVEIGVLADVAKERQGVSDRLPRVVTPALDGVLVDVQAVHQALGRLELIPGVAEFEAVGVAVTVGGLHLSRIDDLPVTELLYHPRQEASLDGLPDVRLQCRS